MRAVFALVAIFLSLAPAFSEDTCPTFSYMKPFDAAKYAGKWYSVAYKEHPTHPGQMSCGKIEIAHSKNVGGKDTLVYKYNYVENGQLGTAHKVAQALHSENPGRFQSVWRMDGASTWSSNYESSVIVTDYENYAVEGVCAHYYVEQNNTFVRSYYSQIMSRTPSLPPQSLEFLKAILVSNDIPLSSIRNIDSSSCNN
ncbi:Hypothetical predicted protein [Cloeon dipterum]|uniref:Lipocalin/cytosolic fatty-acid binding domain-containing protein n=1 Tax=Cloeon dipterum TaxID=197152 RepID=A0A8S1DLG1_9INSE|nr:Hypothetical predicted protein [Cloeon dipterum]